MSAKKAKVILDRKNNCGEIKFYEPVSAITAGQAVVFYSLDDNHLVGGGWIK